MPTNTILNGLLPVALLPLSVVGTARADGVTGPSSSQSPYLVATMPGVVVTSVSTVGDTVNLKPDGATPYRMVGIPDGLGAIGTGAGDDDREDRDGYGGDEEDEGRPRTFTLLMNHEIGGTLSSGLYTPLGAVRAHGNAGAFVSLWTVGRKGPSVVRVEDFLANDYSVRLSNNDPGRGIGHTGYLPGSTTVINRLCSADLAGAGAYRWVGPDGKSYGTTARLFLNGEESSGIATGLAAGQAGNLGPEGSVQFGRQFAWVATDDPAIPGNQARTAYELPFSGLATWENSLASPYSQRRTVVVGTDDSTGGQIYVWLGDKQRDGSVIERAGLTRRGAGDGLYAVRVEGLVPDATGATSELRDAPANGKFSLVSLGDVSGLAAAGLEAASDAGGATQFLRPEDGAWDPKRRNDFYFVTTDRYDQAKDGVGTQVARSRLYRLRFTDIRTPELGGTIEAVLDGTEAGNMFDNITVNRDGQVLIQEDVGNQGHLGRIWLYDIDADTLTEVARHDPARFGDVGVVATAPFNQDEESSGIVDASRILGRGWYLLDVQAHYPTDGELVEGGQLVALYVPPKRGRR